MNYTNYTPTITIWIVFMQSLLALYSARVFMLEGNSFGVKHKLRMSLQYVLCLILAAKYVELYSLIIFHPQTVTSDDWETIPKIFLVYLIIQSVILLRIPHIFGVVLLAAGFVNMVTLILLGG